MDLWFTKFKEIFVMANSAVLKALLICFYHINEKNRQLFSHET